MGRHCGQSSCRRLRRGIQAMSRVPVGRSRCQVDGISCCCVHRGRHRQLVINFIPLQFRFRCFSFPPEGRLVCVLRFCSDDIGGAVMSFRCVVSFVDYRLELFVYGGSPLGGVGHWGDVRARGWW